jgi:hypothetical protein
MAEKVDVEQPAQRGLRPSPGVTPPPLEELGGEHPAGAGFDHTGHRDVFRPDEQPGPRVVSWLVGAALLMSAAVLTTSLLRPSSDVVVPAPSPSAFTPPGPADARTLDELARTLDGNAVPPLQFRLEGFRFAKEESVVPAQAAPIEKRLVALLEAHPNARIRIEGPADPTSTDPGLAQARAQAVKDDLVQRGIHEDRIEVAAQDPGRPVGASPVVDVILLAR